jgi:hypothetical protein
MAQGRQKSGGGVPPLNKIVAAGVIQTFSRVTLQIPGALVRME